MKRWLLAAACHTATAPVANSVPAPAIPPCTGGDCLPAIDYVDTLGNPITRRSLVGRIVIVTFWVPWAMPAVEQLSTLGTVCGDFATTTRCLGIVIEAEPPAGPFPIPIVRGTPEVTGAFGYPQEAPITNIYDRSGKLVLRHIGAMDAPSLRAALEPLLR